MLGAQMNIEEEEEGVEEKGQVNCSRGMEGGRDRTMK